MPVQTKSANARTDPATPAATLAGTAKPPGRRTRTGSTPVRCRAPYTNTVPMKAGSTITSRDSHDVRHIAAERHARSGRPRWKKDATSPAASMASATAAAGP